MQSLGERRRDRRRDGGGVRQMSHDSEEELMFGRKNVATVAGDALDGASPYIDQLAHDEKLRARLVAAITAGAAARKRAKRQVGLLGVATRLGSDPVLRAQVAEVVSQLQKAKGRIEKNRSHKTRNIVLLLTGAGLVVAAVPGLREAVVNKVMGTSDGLSDGASASSSTAADPDVSAPTETTDSGTTI